LISNNIHEYLDKNINKIKEEMRKNSQSKSDNNKPKSKNIDNKPKPTKKLVKKFN
jgi:hypothetical protein